MNYIEGKEVGTEEMLICREKRMEIQKELIQKYNQPLISFTMNIAGPVKTNDLIKKAFDYGKNILLKKLKDSKIEILETLERNEITGDEFWIVANYPAKKLKEVTVMIEEKEKIGRIFDIDVIDKNFEKESRKSFRKCFICELQAQDCGRSRRHSVEDLQKKIKELLENL